MMTIMLSSASLRPLPARRPRARPACARRTRSHSVYHADARPAGTAQRVAVAHDRAHRQQALADLVLRLAQVARVDEHEIGLAGDGGAALRGKLLDHVGAQ